jgi:mannose-6-phosphate isomerase-like protein (cupin superfamily)
LKEVQFSCSSSPNFHFKSILNRVSMAEIIRYRDLEPARHVPGAKEPGFMRWLITWVGGPAGHINTNRDVAKVSQNTVVGMMNLPVGQRQKGLHYHSVAEIYIILRGELEGYDGRGHIPRAGPMDCMYIPAGVPHGVRNSGLEDCDLIWIHDGIEIVGTSVYYMDGIVTGPPQVDDITIVSFKDLEPSYGAHRAKEVGHMRWMINWVAGGPGFENFSPSCAAPSNNVAIGMTVLQPGQKSVPHSHEDAEVYVVMRGKGVMNLGNWTVFIFQLGMCMV